MGSIRPIVVAAFCVLGVGLILHIVALATPEWTTYKLGEAGPFRNCVKGVSCEATGSNYDDVNAVKAMTLLGMISSIFSEAILAVIIVYDLKDKLQIPVLPKGAVGLGVISFVFIMIGVIIWGAKVHKDIEDESTALDFDFDLGYSFALSIVGGILILAGSALSLFGARSP